MPLVRSIVATAAVAGALAAAPAASAADVILAAGNFHLSDNSVGCRWWVKGARGTPIGLGHGGIRCERYSGRLMAEVLADGSVRKVSRWNGWVKPGTVVRRAGWSGVFGNLGCSVVSVTSVSTGRRVPYLRCTKRTRTSQSTLEISSGGATVRRY